MSNYDEILREKEGLGKINPANFANHWAAMEKMLRPVSTPTMPPNKGFPMLKFVKIFLVSAATVAIGYFVYQQVNKSKKKFNGVLKPSNVPSQFFTINGSSDATIRTSHASVLKIKKGTFKTDKPVTIEIKEVFTPQEILQSGLTTMAGNQPLRSAGMLYFNATAEGDKIEPSIPIDAFIPTKDKDTAMQIFKGEIQNDSTVNWVEPAPISDTLDKDLEHHIAYGKQLFQSKCASCHQIFKDGTGPTLKNLQTRGPWKNPIELRKWINNPAAFMATNKYTQDLKSKFGSMMTAYPDISDIDIVGLLAYINSVDKLELYNQKTIDTIGTDGAIEIDCGVDTTYYSIQNNFEEYDSLNYVNLDSLPIVQSDAPTFDFKEYEGIYQQGYDFKIEANGWYNVDAFLKTEANETENVSLTVDIENGETLPYNVYVFVPTERVMQYYTTKKGNTYLFNFENNKIPLPLRYRAIIIAFGSKGQQLLYGASEFVIQKEQTIKVTLKETTKEGLLNMLYTHNINGIQIDAIEKEMYVSPKPCPDKRRPMMDTSYIIPISAK
jgi:hypothetical protein